MCCAAHDFVIIFLKCVPYRRSHFGELFNEIFFGPNTPYNDRKLFLIKYQTLLYWNAFQVILSNLDFLPQWPHLGVKSCPCGTRLKDNRQIQYKNKLTACAAKHLMRKTLFSFKDLFGKTWLLAVHNPGVCFSVRSQPTHRCKRDNIDKVLHLLWNLNCCLRVLSTSCYDTSAIVDKTYTKSKQQLENNLFHST